MIDIDHTFFISTILNHALDLEAVALAGGGGGICAPLGTLSSFHLQKPRAQLFKTNNIIS